MGKKQNVWLWFSHDWVSSFIFRASAHFAFCKMKVQFFLFIYLSSSLVIHILDIPFFYSYWFSFVVFIRSYLYLASLVWRERLCLLLWRLNVNEVLSVLQFSSKAPSGSVAAGPRSRRGSPGSAPRRPPGRRGPPRCAWSGTPPPPGGEGGPGHAPGKTSVSSGNVCVYSGPRAPECDICDLIS